jgi:DHA1 family multidrug resistance protein-like MFS transporter
MEVNMAKRLFSPFILLCGTGMFAIFSSTMSKNPVLPLFTKDLGASDSVIGLVAAASTIIGIVVSLPAGVFSDFYGRRKVMIFAAFVFASAPFLYFLVNSPWQLAIVRVYHGIATAVFGPVAMATVADLFKEKRAENMGWYSSSTLVGRSLAPVVGGFIIYQTHNFKLVYLGCGIAGIIAFILAFLIPHKQEVMPVTSKFKDKLKEMGKGLKEIGKSRGIMITSMIEAFQYLAFGALETFLPLYCMFVGINPAAIGLLFTIQLVGTTLTKPFMGKMSDKYGRRQMISLGLILGAIALGIIPFFKSFWTLIPATVMFGISLATVTASTAAFVSDLAKAGSYGSALGVMSTIMDVGHSSGPIISSQLLRYGPFMLGMLLGKNVNLTDRASYLSMFIIVATILFIAGIFYPILVGKSKNAESEIHS